jgi:hypothetical protein
MTIKVPAEEPSRRRTTSSISYLPSLLLPSLFLIASIFLDNTGRSASSFPVRSSPIVRAASAMSTDPSGAAGDNRAASGGAKIPPPRAEEGGEVGGGGRGLPQNVDDGGDPSEQRRVLQLPEATNDPSIPTIKLGGEWRGIINHIHSYSSLFGSLFFLFPAFPLHLVISRPLPLFSRKHPIRGNGTRHHQRRRHHATDRQLGSNDQGGAGGGVEEDRQEERGAT